MIEINNEKQLEAWLEDKPREVSIAIGVRAALRAAPLTADLAEENPARHSAGQLQDHGNVMRGERPQCVFLAANFAQAEAVGINVAKDAEAPRLDGATQGDEGRMVEQQMTDHQGQAAIMGQTGETAAFGDIQAQRLFDEHVLARRQRRRDQLAMARCRRRDGDRRDRVAGEQIRRVGERGGVGILSREVCHRVRIDIAERRQRAERAEISH